MTSTTPCYRHPRDIWMVACPDCTAWHMAVELAHRDEVGPVRATARRADRASSGQSGAQVPPVALHLAA
jgi:hypothetical protein